jgi:hypothetical protein
MGCNWNLTSKIKLSFKESEKMLNNGKIKWDDLSTSLQSDIATTVSGGGSGFVGYGFNPLGAVIRLDDDNPAIQYSVGDWIKHNPYAFGRETIVSSLNAAYVTQTTKIGASLTVSFTGTGLYLNGKMSADQGLLSVVVDGVAQPNIDMYSVNANYGGYAKVVDNLVHGTHTAKITLIGKNASATNAIFLLAFFDVLAQPVGKNLLTPFNQTAPVGANGGWVTYAGSPTIVNPYTIMVDSANKLLFSYPATVGQVFSFSMVSGGMTGRINITWNDGSIGTTYDTSGSGLLKFENMIAPVGATTIAIRILGTIAGLVQISNPMLNIGSIALPFETNGYDKVALAKDSLWNKSSAFVGGNKVDATTDLTQSITEITNLVPNANFERISPTWGTVFQDDFNRANGVAGNGWTNAPTISSNQLSIPINSATLNGDSNWTDRQIRFSFIAPSAAIYIYHKRDGSVIGLIRTSITTGTSNNINFEKQINGAWTFNLSPLSYTITAGVTYYVTAKVQGNIYSTSITTNADYVTSASTTYYYTDELPNGRIALEAGANASGTLFDNVVVTAPIPDMWSTFSGGALIGQSYSFSDGYVKMNNPQTLNASTNESYFTSNYFTLQPSTIYTIKYDVKGSDANAQHEYFILSNTGTYVQGANGTVLTTDWQTVSYTFTTTSNITGTNQFIRFDNNGKLSGLGSGQVYIRNVMIVYGSTAPSFHTKESRCDLISLQNDGQVITTQGTGTSELGYNVGNNGSVSFYRDKRTVQHWDRVKTWYSGTFVNIAGGTGASNTRLETTTTNDSFYISFVGTGIDIYTSPAYNSGFIGVSIDGGTEFLIDCYIPASGFTASKFTLAKNLSYGQHTIKIRNTGTRNTLSTNTYMRVESFDIYVPAIPTNPSPTTLLPVSAIIKADPDNGWIRYDNAEGVLFSGASWSGSTSPSFYNGIEWENASTSTTDYAEFSFIGNGVRWIGYKATTVGIAEVLIDSISQGMVDTYSNVNIPQYALYSTSLATGLHLIRVRMTNTKNASSTNVGICIDAFDVKNTMYVIDLRKNQSQVLIEQKIAEHEAKDLWDAHPQAIKGKNNRERREDGNTSAIVATAGTFVTVNVTYAKAFTVPPKLKMWFTSQSVGIAGYLTTTIQSNTTTGFTLYVNSYVAQTLSIDWEAIGY